MHNRVLITAASLALLILAAGCARFPEGAATVTGRRIIITMTVAGEIDSNYHYYVAFDTSGAATPGPLPAVAPPWGNGWGAGNITHYVAYEALVQPFGGYGVYRIVGPDLLNPIPVGNGAPISWVVPPPGSNKLQFTIDISQLDSPTLPDEDIDVINVNFITTDKLPLDPNAPIEKYYDGLGDRGNDFLSISVRTNQTFSNSQTNIERPGDVPLPNLDIIDWTIEIQSR